MIEIEKSFQFNPIIWKKLNGAPHLIGCLYLQFKYIIMGAYEIELKLLNELWGKNYMNERVYLNAAVHGKNLFIKHFFNTIRRQKYLFGLKIKNQIFLVEKELDISGKYCETEKENLSLKKDSFLPLFRYEKDELIKQCYRREKTTLHHCDYLLSQLFKGGIREMLLYHKQEIRSNLCEIKAMGIKAGEKGANIITA